MSERVEFFGLLALALAAAVISVLDFLGVLEQTLNGRIPTMILLLLGILTSYLAFERRNKLDSLHISVEGLYEAINKTKEQILSQPFPGLEFYNSTDDLLIRMAEITVGAEIVCTLNLSPERGTSPALDEYFTKIHKYIRLNNNALKSFRTLASLESYSKAEWILERADELVATGKISTSIFPRDTNIFIPVGFHVVYNRRYQAPFVFFYPPVNPGGVMNCFLIKDEKVADIMLSYFERLWASSPPLHLGKRVYMAGLNEIAKVDPTIKDLAQFKNLEKLIPK